MRKLFVTALSLGALAAVASAQTDPGVVYAVIGDGNSTSVTPSTSQNPGGGAVTSARTGTGTYAVTFTGTNAQGWSVMAEASGSASNYCLAGANNSTPASEIDVGCFTSSGAPVNSPFVVSGFGPGNLKNIAYALVQSTGVLAAAAFNFNPSGTIVPNHVATGHYTVLFNGLNGAGGGNVQVSAGVNGNTTDATCYAGQWSGASALVHVWCVSPGGAATDANFHVAFIPAGASPAGAAFLWANDDTNASYTPDSGHTFAPGSVQVTRTGTGVYTVALAGLPTALGGLIRATAYSATSSANYCHTAGLAALFTGAAGSLRVGVDCFQANSGAAADSAFTFLAIAPPLTMSCNPAAAPVTLGVPYSTTCTGAGGFLPYSFTVKTGTLPAGLTLTPTSSTAATISGTPTAAGSFNYEVSLNNSDSAAATFTGAITAATPLTFTCNPTTGPVTVNVAYSSTCTAAGGVAPYAFTLPSNGVNGAQVPPGLTSTNTATTATVSGTPTQTGAYNYGVKVTDSETVPVSITVNFAGNVAAAVVAPTLTSLNPSSATAGGAAFTLIVSGSNFTSTAQIQWNGSPLATAFVSATQLNASISAALIASAGSVTVTVSQGGSVSGGQTFTINASSAPAAPAIFNNGIVSSASFTPAQAPGGAVAQGSIFSIFGNALGPPVGAQQPSFPLVNTLSGVSIQVISGSTQLNAIPLYVSPGLINAIMPSNTPLGRVSVQVTFNGVASNMAAVTVAANAPSIYTATGAGLGPGVFQNATDTGVQQNAASQTVMQNQIGILWLTGLGGISTPDNQPPPVGNLSYPVEIWIGGQPVTNIAYSGRTPCCSGLDEIVYTVPAGAPSGCFVPVTVRVAGVAVSNTVTIAVDPNGKPCSDPISGAYTQGGNFGTIALVRRTTHVPSANPPDLVVDVAMAGFSQEAGAPFAFSSIASLPPAGSCAVYSGQGNYFNADSPYSTPSAKALMAGTLMVAGTGNPVALMGVTDLQGSSEYLGLLGSAGVLPASSPGPAPFLNPGQFTISSTAGADVGAFSFALTVPSPAVTWTNRSQIIAVDRTQPLTFNWSGTSYLVELEGINYDVPTNTSVEFQCVAPAGATSFTVPNWVLTNFPATRSNPKLSNSFLGIAAATAPVAFQATGLNNTAASYVLLQGINVTFK
jgi:uncharacterized protein (TIGR03437 family)